MHRCVRMCLSAISVDMRRYGDVVSLVDMTGVVPVMVTARGAVQPSTALGADGALQATTDGVATPPHDRVYACMYMSMCTVMYERRYACVYTHVHVCLYACAYVCV